MVNGESLVDGLEVLVSGSVVVSQQVAPEGLVQSLLLCVQLGTGVVKDGHHPRRPLVLDQVAHNVIVEVLDFPPLDAFLNIFLLQKIKVIKGSIHEPFPPHCITHLNRDKIESNLSVPVIQGHQENPLIESFEMSPQLICL